MTKINWKYFDVHQLIANRDEKDEEFAKITNKQDKNFKTLMKCFYKM